MEPKHGIAFDYDLMANMEESARHAGACVVCEAELRFRWSDKSGEAMCLQCGTPYQLKWGTDEQDGEGNYPYLNMKAEFVPIARQYWQERKAFVHYGCVFGRGKPGMAELIDWLESRYPEWITEG